MKRRIRSFLAIVLATAIMPVFNNCSNSAGVPSASSTTSTKQRPHSTAGIGGGLNYNGGGHLGKMTYSHFAWTPLCKNNTPERIINIDAGSARLVQNQCSSQNAQSINILDLVRSEYQSSYIAHEDYLYVEESILQKSHKRDRVSVIYFCSAPTYKDVALGTTGLDVAVRFHKTYLGPRKFRYEFFAHILMGRLPYPPHELEIAGKLQEDSSRPKQWGNFKSDISPVALNVVSVSSPRNVQALFTRENGEQLLMDCYQH